MKAISNALIIQKKCNLIEQRLLGRDGNDTILVLIFLGWPHGHIRVL